MPNYTTKQGDMVDWICWHHYGTERGGVVEAVLEANPFLASRGPVLPKGLTVFLPELPTPAADEPVIRLWE